MPGVATADSQSSFDAAANGSVFPDGLNEVVAATRFKPAILSQHRSDAELVKSHPGNQQKSRDLPESRADSHEGGSAVLLLCSNRLISIFASAVNDRQ